MNKETFKLFGLNFTVRLKNPQFILRLIVAIFVPILAYLGMDVSDLTSFPILLDTIKQAVSNPYIWIFTVINVINILSDPTTNGFSDSERALNYTKP